MPTLRASSGATAVGLALLAIACTVPGIALFNRKSGSDIPVYQQAGEGLVHGSLPYRDFSLEYPPGALPVFVVPTAGPADQYVQWFKAEQAVLAGIVCWLVALLLAAGGASKRQLYAGTALVPVALGIFGPTLLGRYDLWPTGLLLGALLALVAGRPRLGLALLGASVAAKGFALALLLPALVYVSRRHGRAALRASSAWFVAVIAVAVLPFLALGPGGLRFTLESQLRRPLQVESFGAAILEVAKHLGAYHPSVVSTYGSQNLSGSTASAVAALSSVLLVLGVAGVWLAFVRGRADAHTLVAACLASLAVVVAFGKVLSPQFLIWLIPFAPLLAGRAALVTGSLTLGATALTRAWFPRRYGDVVALGDSTWLVLVRDLILVLLVVAAAAELLRLSGLRARRAAASLAR